jgi:tetratricopeptide (TPR) repeat protein/tRNA A-37 threonylcarbamoyl transferase component Bud32
MSDDPAPASFRDTASNLLFGLLALQNNFIGRDALVAAFGAWIADKSRPLDQLLLDRGHLDADCHALLMGLVRQHLKLHGDDPEKSLADLSAMGSVLRRLVDLGDPDLSASLGHVTEAHSGGQDTDPEATCTLLGAPTSSGGRFRVLRLHAEGGLGEVYVARDEEVRREVALKQIKAEYAADPQGRARFLLEAEITGGLEHPGIVPVYGLGTYDDGRPFYAMRFIKGDSLKDAIGRFHADEATQKDPGRRTLALNRLLRGFLDVCNALSYAHSRGVLHRDLKPGNIMLGDYGETLVVDWGLAKAVGRRLEPAAATRTERTLRPESGSDVQPSVVGSRLGTPAYMPPEQAAGRLDELGAPSDVYSLGATLYALLTGQPPFTEPDLPTMLRQVEQGEFPRPRQACPWIDPALEAACLKAMALRPEDRYPSPRALAEDIEHWLADEPVSAYPEPWPVRLGRWGRRHRSLVATAVAILATATVGLAAGLVAVNAEKNHTEQARLAESQQRALAQAREQEARDKEAEARAVLGFVQDKILAAARPEGQAGGLGREVSLRKALEAALPQVESSFQGRPLIEAAVRMTVGTSFLYLGDAGTAERQFRIARARYTARLGADHPDRLRSMNNLAASYADLGRHAEALKLFEETLALRKVKLGADHPDTLSSMNNLAITYADLGRHTEALKLRRETLALQKAKLGADHPDTLSSMNNLAISYAILGRHAEALKLRRETLALRKAKLGADHPDTLSSMSNLAASYADLSRHAEALKLFEETLALLKVKLGADHPDTLSSMSNLAASYADLGRHAEALQLRRETLALQKAKLGADHPDTLRSMNNLAISYADLGRHAEALKLRRETLALRKAKLGADHPDTLTSMGNFAESLVALDRPSEAVAIIDDCLRRAETKVVDRRLVPFVLDLRLRAFARQKDAAGCRQTAEFWEKLHRTDASDLYQAACFRAVTAGLLRAAARTPAADRQADSEADRAMNWLARAVAAGYPRPQDLVHMIQDPDLDALRGRADFRRLLAEQFDRGFPADPFAR